jgi:hypothetical protein
MQDLAVLEKRQILRVAQDDITMRFGFAIEAAFRRNFLAIF